MWGFYDGYTAAQIELLAIDCPITTYAKNKKGNGKNEPARADADDVRRSADAWRNKYKGKDAKVELDLSEFTITKK